MDLEGLNTWLGVAPASQWKDTLHWIDNRVRERIFASRSHAFEYAVRKLMKQGSQSLEY